MNELTEENNK